MQISALPSNVSLRSSAPATTDHVDNLLALLLFLYADLPVLLRPRTAVMATKSRHFSEVMATVQISVVAEEKKRS